MLFVRADGTIAKIATHTEPSSVATISSNEPVRGVIEINAGEADRRGIHTGDKVDYPAFRRMVNDEAAQAGNAAITSSAKASDAVRPGDLDAVEIDEIWRSRGRARFCSITKSVSWKLARANLGRMPA